MLFFIYFFYFRLIWLVSINFAFICSQIFLCNCQCIAILYVCTRYLRMRNDSQKHSHKRYYSDQRSIEHFKTMLSTTCTRTHSATEKKLNIENTPTKKRRINQTWKLNGNIINGAPVLLQSDQSTLYTYCRRMPIQYEVSTYVFLFFIHFNSDVCICDWCIIHTVGAPIWT